ncbi:MAG: DNA-binding response regulator, partial [Bacteroidota bacterium]
MAEARPLVEAHQPDLVFLDITMPLDSGFALLDGYDHLPFEVIFTTA